MSVPFISVHHLTRLRIPPTLKFTCLCIWVFMKARLCQCPTQRCDTRALALIDFSRLGCDPDRGPARNQSASDLYSNSAAWLGAAWLSAAPTGTRGEEPRGAAC